MRCCWIRRIDFYLLLLHVFEQSYGDGAKIAPRCCHFCVEYHLQILQVSLRVNSVYIQVLEHLIPAAASSTLLVKVYFLYLHV